MPAIQGHENCELVEIDAESGDQTYKCRDCGAVLTVVGPGGKTPGEVLSEFQEERGQTTWRKWGVPLSH